MRKTIASVSMVAAAGALIAAGGAYSVFNDAKAAAGGFTAGTVKLAVTGQHPATDIFALAGPCTQRYQDGQSPTDSLNLGTINNKGCSSTFTVHNAGSLPFTLAGTTVSDTNPNGLSCVASTITDGTKNSQALSPGADQLVTVATSTVGDAAGCQNLTDKVTVHLTATETKLAPPGEVSNDGYFTIGSTFVADPNETTYLYGISGNPTSLVLTMAGGATKTVTTTDARLQGVATQGWWNPGGHGLGNTNYIVGLLGGTEYRDFWSFPTSGITGHVTAAALNIPNTASGGAGTETFWSVHTPAASLVAGGGGNQAILDDLGSGTSFGNQHVAPGAGTVVVALNDAAVANLNQVTGH